MSRCWLAALALVLFGCSSAPAPGGARAGLPASPQFCGWAEAVIDSTPTVPMLVEGQVLDIDRLVRARSGLTRFADTLATAATHAPSDSQADFTSLAEFNRLVASVIAGEAPFDQGGVEAAEAAAEGVSRTISQECGLAFDPADGLAYTGEG